MNKEMKEDIGTAFYGLSIGLFVAKEIVETLFNVSFEEGLYYSKEIFEQYELDKLGYGINGGKNEPRKKETNR